MRLLNRRWTAVLLATVAIIAVAGWWWFIRLSGVERVVLGTWEAPALDYPAYRLTWVFRPNRRVSFMFIPPPAAQVRGARVSRTLGAWRVEQGEIVIEPIGGPIWELRRGAMGHIGLPVPQTLREPEWRFDILAVDSKRLAIRAVENEDASYVFRRPTE